MVASSLSQVRPPPAASSNSGVGGRVHVSLESENSNVELMGGVPGGEFGCEMASKTSSCGGNGGVFASGYCSPCKGKGGVLASTACSPGGSDGDGDFGGVDGVRSIEVEVEGKGGVCMRGEGSSMFAGGGDVRGGRRQISLREAAAGSKRVEAGRSGRDGGALMWCMALLRILPNAAWTGVTRVPPILLASMDPLAPGPPRGSYSPSLISPSSLSSGAAGGRFGLPILSASEGFGLEMRSRRTGACCVDDVPVAAPKISARAGGRGSCEREREVRAAALSWRISDGAFPGRGGRVNGGCGGEGGR